MILGIIVPSAEIAFHRLLNPIAPAYFGMTFPEHRGLLNQLESSSEIIAVGATLGEEPVGLGLARHDPNTGEGEVLSILIVPPLQRRGLGTVMLQVLEEVLVASGCARGSLSYSTELPSTPAFERVLQKRQWTPPRLHMLLARIVDLRGGAAMRGVAGAKLQPPFSIFPWVELAPQERASLEQKRESIPAALWPFLEETAPLEPVTSLGLRFGEEVAGWLITHRVAPDAVRYTSLYVHARWRSTKALMALLREAALRQVEVLGPNVHITLAVLAGNTPMIRLVERKFRPFSLPLQERRATEKVLTSR